MAARRPSLERKRQEFIEYLRTVGAGDECILIPWLKPQMHLGVPDYGRLMVNRQKLQAHRWVYEQMLGPVPKELNVLHSCDNPPCVRPSHLWAGTPSDNTQDALHKGRLRPGLHGHQRSGERHWKSKLTDQQIREIRYFATIGVNQYELAAKYGVGQPHISSIVRGAVRKGV